MSLTTLAVLILIVAPPPGQESAPAASLFDRENLVAWCVVPFDAMKRGPEERAEMLDGLGLKRLAYDWRAEHLPTFDDELEQLQRYGIELTALWFPSTLDDDARFLLDALSARSLTPQLWVTGGGEPTSSPEEQAERVAAEAARIRPIAEAAAEVGCSVALYNHGGWFGEPENQIAVIEALGLPNVGIVYNLHHGHDHLDRFAELLETMKPHLLALNLNGMDPEGDRHGRKILPIGDGREDARILELIWKSGWTGPVGILDHVPEADAEQQLRANLDGLTKLLDRLELPPASDLGADR